MRDARDLVVLAVGGAYLQVIATKERVKSARAQFETANASISRMRKSEASAWWLRLTSNRSEVEALAQQQRVTSFEKRSGKTKSVWLE